MQADSINFYNYVYYLNHNTVSFFSCIQQDNKRIIYSSKKAHIISKITITISYRYMWVGLVSLIKTKHDLHTCKLIPY